MILALETTSLLGQFGPHPSQVQGSWDPGHQSPKLAFDKHRGWSRYMESTHGQAAGLTEKLYSSEETHY